MRTALRGLLRDRRVSDGCSDLRENEQIHIWNIANGECFITYVIRAERASGIIPLNGSAARRAAVGDLVIIAAFGLVAETDLDSAQPRLVFVDADNRIRELRSTIPVQRAEG